MARRALLDFSPLADVADAAILLGAAGLVTGWGGKYFGVVPVLDKGVNGMAWGTPGGKWFGEPAPWDAFKSQNPTLGLGYSLRSYGMIITGGTFFGWGLSQYPDSQTWPNAPPQEEVSIYSSTLTQDPAGWTVIPTPGPMGQQGGWVWIGLFVGGVLVRVARAVV